MPADVTRLMTGSEACVRAALLAGCRSFYGYPITPASEITEAAARLFPAAGGTFLQAESEVAAIVDIMRAGPGLGSLGPEQGDYHQIVKGGGHGNYRTLVLAPASVPEMVSLTFLAFELADRYRNPVVLLADGIIGQMAEPVRLQALDAGWIAGA